MKTKKSKLQPPKYIWADCDPEAPRSARWAFYTTLADQRGNRPDLKPIKLRIVPNDKGQPMSEQITKQWCATCNDWKEHGTWQHEGQSELAAPTGSGAREAILNLIDRGSSCANAASNYANGIFDKPELVLRAVEEWGIAVKKAAWVLRQNT